MSEDQSANPERRRITFVEALGRGGFGAVYLADIRRRANLEQRLAVKVLNEDLGDNDDVVRRQRDEARLLAQLNHDHIVKVFDLVEIDSRPAVMMEYVPGVDTSRLARQGPIPVRAVLEIVAATASALHAAYTTVSPFTGRPLRVVHRDIKPSNLLLSEQGIVKVLDFGIARADFDREGQTRSVAFGTARYMAPEQWMNGPMSAAVDIYALGITMLELLTGRASERLPLRADKFIEARERQISGVRDPRWGTVWWRELERLLGGMIALDPADRMSAEEVQEVCMTLSEEVGGMSLRRYARKEVPGLIQARRARLRGSVLLPSADLVMTSPQDPSLLTASKSIRSAGLKRRLGRDSARQALLFFALALALWWFISA